MSRMGEFALNTQTFGSSIPAKSPSMNQPMNESIYSGTPSAAKMGVDRGGFKFPSWTPPTQAPGFFRGGGGMMLNKGNK